MRATWCSLPVQWQSQTAACLSPCSDRAKHDALVASPDDLVADLGQSVLNLGRDQGGQGHVKCVATTAMALLSGTVVASILLVSYTVFHPCHKRRSPYSHQHHRNAALRNLQLRTLHGTLRR